MVNQKVTPEERLLRLIESEHKKEPGEKSSGKASPWSVRTWGRGLFSRRPGPSGIFSRMRVSPEFHLQWVNRILIVLLVLVVAGIVFNANNTREIPQNLIDPIDVPQSADIGEPLENPRTASLKPLADYLKVVEKRSLFLPAPLPKPEKPVVQKEPPPLQKPPPPDPLKILRERVKSLKLVGISWGERPTAMIEDTVTKETSFIRVGEVINEVEVKAILKDRAILSYGGAEYDLF